MALLESEKFANNIIESFNDGLIVLDQELKIISANSTFYNIFNIPADSLKGKFIREIFNNRLDVTKLMMLVDQLTPENNHSDSIEFEYMPADSENKNLLMTVNKIFHSKLATGLILLTIKDVITS